MKDNENIKISTEEWARIYVLGNHFYPTPYQDKLYNAIGNEVPIMVCTDVCPSMDAARERFKERFREFFELVKAVERRHTLVLADDSTITEQDINTLQQLFKKPLTVIDFSTFVGKKEFKKVRKEEPAYRKLEKKVGYKGKVKVNKGERRKWYV